MCDTFIAFPPATIDGSVVFAKNSDRPAGEGQTTHIVAAAEHEAGTSLQCTYIEIPQVAKTRQVLLSKIDWMWGVEMGANDAGVVIGNEAVWTNLPPGPPALLGMDLVRLGLERGGSARQAVEVITSLLEEFGQGGACAQNDPGFTYDNSYLIADRTEGWILETAGRHWAAWRVTSGTANISNRLSIRTDHDLCSNSLQEFADSSGPIDFAALFSEASLNVEHGSREYCGGAHLAKHAGKITPDTMKSILRDHESGICMHGGFETTASMISQLHKGGEMSHWLTDHHHPCEGSYRRVEDFG